MFAGTALPLWAQGVKVHGKPLYLIMSAGGPDASADRTEDAIQGLRHVRQSLLGHSFLSLIVDAGSDEVVTRALLEFDQLTHRSVMHRPIGLNSDQARMIGFRWALEAAGQHVDANSALVVFFDGDRDDPMQLFRLIRMFEREELDHLFAPSVCPDDIDAKLLRSFMSEQSREWQHYVPGDCLQIHKARRLRLVTRELLPAYLRYSKAEEPTQQMMQTWSDLVCQLALATGDAGKAKTVTLGCLGDRHEIWAETPHEVAERVKIDLRVMTRFLQQLRESEEVPAEATA